jgi:hypothetical protein
LGSDRPECADGDLGNDRIGERARLAVSATWLFLGAIACFAARHPVLGVFCLIVAALAAV